MNSYGKVRFSAGATVLRELDVTLDSGTGQYGATLYYWVPTVAGTETITAQYLGTAANAPSSVTGSVSVR